MSAINELKGNVTFGIFNAERCRTEGFVSQHDENSIYSPPPPWIKGKGMSPVGPSIEDELNTKHPYIRSAIRYLSSSPAQISNAAAKIQQAMEFQTANYNKDPSPTYIDAIHSLHAALADIKSIPNPNISEAINKLMGAIDVLRTSNNEGQSPELFDMLDTIVPVASTKKNTTELQQSNCFNQTYSGSTCPQSTIETFMINLNTFKNATGTIIECLQASNNTQYEMLLRKLKNIQSFVNKI